ncbi:MAG: hypothetical protein COB53_05985 [Elusimicrobia bacterium]|nr:MAG: hypothetical protein COB53_05985 [Elusimicrobiota bacterium]
MFIPLLLVAALTGTAGQPLPSLAASTHPSKEQRPLNVLIIDICSARADHFGTYGYSRDTTPGMDKFANENVLFENAMAQSSWCLPNYASLLTGHIPEVHGQYIVSPFLKPDKTVPTMAEKMKEAGYRTAAFSGGIFSLQAWGLDRGFDVYEALFSTRTHEPRKFADYSPRALDWLKKDPAKPFFLYTTVDDLHAPYQSDNPNRYSPDSEGSPISTMAAHVRFFRAYNGEPIELADPLRSFLKEFREEPAHLQQLIARYDASLNHVDRKVSDFLSQVKNLGLWDNTLIIVTADHGELLNEQGLLGHTESLYEPVLHVPLMVHHPDYAHRAGTRVRGLVQRIDLTPTVYEAAGVDYEHLQLQGKSLISLLENPSANLREYAFASSKRSLAAGRKNLDIDERVVRDQRWKLHWYQYKDRFELYDLLKDPLETQDLAEQRPDIISRLSFQLLNHFESSRPHAPGLPYKREPPNPVQIVPRTQHLNRLGSSEHTP